MAVFNEQFASGIPFMDNSAKGFISELNKLSDAMKSGEGRSYVIFALDYLKDYCDSYLALENKVMLQYDFYDYPNHVELHAQFREEILELCDKYEKSGADHSMPLVVQRMMAGWLMRHISKPNMVLADFLKAKLAKQKHNS